ncbi:hypothetical protein CBR_g20975 [Chara braunii]|uniref:DOMON domain-containing protein n=1 Tax=Chara braunii TaxID=69332 RepID=A0A388L077_CHABU|nr:hypothetical protein CBR_g20975 [Chara braunii]|eukprot:GBG75724.1 hypothetical protein CBR_g20975 [Chara braunii]
MAAAGRQRLCRSQMGSLSFVDMTTKAAAHGAYGDGDLDGDPHDEIWSSSNQTRWRRVGVGCGLPRRHRRRRRRRDRDRDLISRCCSSIPLFSSSWLLIMLVLIASSGVFSPAFSKKVRLFLNGEGVEYQPCPYTSTTELRGFSAPIQSFSHNVSGLLTIIDSCAFVVQNFRFDSEGANWDVYWKGHPDPDLSVESMSSIQAVRLNEMTISGNYDGSVTLLIALSHGLNWNMVRAIAIYCECSEVFGGVVILGQGDLNSPVLASVLAEVFPRGEPGRSNNSLASDSRSPVSVEGYRGREEPHQGSVQSSSVFIAPPLAPLAEDSSAMAVQSSEHSPRQDSSAARSASAFASGVNARSQETESLSVGQAESSSPAAAGISGTSVSPEGHRGKPSPVTSLPSSASSPLISTSAVPSWSPGDNSSGIATRSREAPSASTRNVSDNSEGSLTKPDADSPGIWERCVMLIEDMLNVYWTIDLSSSNGVVTVTYMLEGRAGWDNWMAFGFSNVTTGPAEMVGSNVTIVGMPTGEPMGFADHFSLSGKYPCQSSGQTNTTSGVCKAPTSIDGNEYPNTIELISSRLVDDVLRVTYRTPLRVNQDTWRWAVFAIGPLAVGSTSANPLPQKHYVSGSMMFNLVYMAGANNCTELSLYPVSSWLPVSSSISTPLAPAPVQARNGSSSETYESGPGSGAGPAATSNDGNGRASPVSPSPSVSEPGPSLPASMDSLPSPAALRGSYSTAEELASAASSYMAAIMTSDNDSLSCMTSLNWWPTNYTFCRTLQGSGFKLLWRNLDVGWLDVLFIGHHDGWVGLGFSDDGMMAGSSAIVGYSTIDSGPRAAQYFLASPAPSGVKPGNKLDVAGLEVRAQNGSIVLEFSVKLSVGNDIKRTWILWAKGPTPGPTSQELPQHSERHSQQINFRTGRLYDQPDRARLAHAWMSVVCWGVILPVGIIYARYAEKFRQDLLLPHVVIQSVGYIAGVASSAIGISLSTQSGMSSKYRHHLALGVILVIITPCMILSSVMLQKMDLIANYVGASRTRKIQGGWSNVHWWFVCGLLVFIPAQIIIGFTILQPATLYGVMYAVMAGVFVLIFLVLEVAVFCFCQASPAALGLESEQTPYGRHLQVLREEESSPRGRRRCQARADTGEVTDDSGTNFVILPAS